jgi:hypothetical protein
LNEDGEAFQVLFVRGDRRILGPAKLSLEAAVAAEELTGAIWSGQTIFGRGSLVAEAIP